MNYDAYDSGFDEEEDVVDVTDVIDDVDEFIEHVGNKISELIDEQFNVIPTEEQLDIITSAIVDILSLYVY